MRKAAFILIFITISLFISCSGEYERSWLEEILSPSESNSSKYFATGNPSYELELNPMSKKKVGFVPPNALMDLHIYGSWCPGGALPCCGSRGNPDIQYNGANLGCGIVSLIAKGGGLVKRFPYTGIATISGGSSGVYVYVVMNDKNLNDNYADKDAMGAKMY